MRVYLRTLGVGLFSLCVGAIANAAALKALQPTQTLPYPPNFYSSSELQFGSELQLSGDSLIVMASDSNRTQRAAFIYRRGTGNRWRFETQLEPPSGVFQGAASVYRDTAVLTGIVDSGNVGFVYRRTAQGWTHMQTIALGSAPDPVSVGVGLNYLVFGIDSANDYQGEVRTFNLASGTYAPSATIRPPETDQGWLFGRVVKMRGNTFAVYAVGGEVVYPYRRVNGKWQLEDEIPLYDFFSPQFAYSGEDLAIGSADDYSRQVRLLRRFNGGWAEYQMLSSAPGTHSLSPDAIAGKNLYASGDDYATNTAHTYWYHSNKGKWTLAGELLNGSESVASSSDADVQRLTSADENTVALRVDAHTDDPSLEGEILLYDVNCNLAK